MFLVCFQTISFGGESKEEIKTLITFKLAEHITWANQKSQSVYTTGFIGDDIKQFSELQSYAADSKLKGRNIEVIHVSPNGPIPEVQLLYVDKNNSKSIENIWKQIAKKNILLITEESNDERFIMLNLMYNTNKEVYSFQVNRANLILEGFTIDPNLLLLGGTEVDVRELFVKMRSDLGIEKEKVRSQAQILRELENEIDKANTVVKDFNKRVQDYDRRIKNQKTEIGLQEEVFKKLTFDIALQNTDLHQKSIDLQEQRARYDTLIAHADKQTKHIRDKVIQLQSLTDEIAKNRVLLTAKEKVLDSQVKTLGIQKSRIYTQNIVLYLAAILLIMTIGLGYVLFRAYQLKKKSTLLLEQRVAERTTDLKGLNIQLNDEIDVRRNTENALKISEEYFREIYNASSDVMFVLDKNTGKIIRTNLSVEKMYGYTIDETIGMTVDQISSDIPPYTIVEARIKISAALNGKSQLFEWQAMKKNKETFWCEVALKKVNITGEEYLLAVVRDVDERKKLEDRLIQSEKLEAIGQLAGGIAHDFNNQLAGILGYTELIHKATRETIPKAAEFTEKIIKSIQRSSDLTSQLLAYARKGKNQFEQVDLHLIINEVSHLLEHSIDKRITIEQNLGAEYSITIGDSSQLQNALLNISLNARDAMHGVGTLSYTTKNGILENTETTNTLEKQECIQITITDTGVGIPQNIQEKIFEPFFTTKNEGEGTGMGLAAVYGTIKNHKGGVAVNSEEGKGTTFTIYLPINKTNSPSNQHSIPSKTIVQKSGTILLVDDDEMVREVNTYILEDCGYTVIACEDGKVAIEKYTHLYKEIDFVLLDLIMPNLSGKDTFFALKAINPDILVLIASGYSINDDVRFLLKEGAKGMIQKPFSQNELIDKINTVILRS
ncbi:MAG: YfiR/HmsC family protein [Fibrobacterales bacterium]